MNKRIEELAEQISYIWHASGDPQIYEFTPEKLEKFAELIVQDCTNIFSDQMKNYRFDEGAHLGLGDVRFTIGMEEDMTQKIKEHFGVEE